MAMVIMWLYINNQIQKYEHMNSIHKYLYCKKYDKYFVFDDERKVFTLKHMKDIGSNDYYIFDIFDINMKSPSFSLRGYQTSLLNVRYLMIDSDKKLSFDRCENIKDVKAAILHKRYDVTKPSEIDHNSSFLLDILFKVETYYDNSWFTTLIWNENTQVVECSR